MSTESSFFFGKDIDKLVTHFNDALSAAYMIVRASSTPATFAGAWSAAQVLFWADFRALLRRYGCPEDRLAETCRHVAAAANRKRDDTIQLAELATVKPAGEA